MRRHDKYVLKLCAKQVDNRQASRFNAFLKHDFGGPQAIQSFLFDRTFVHWWIKDKKTKIVKEVPCTRILPELIPELIQTGATKPGPKRYPNRNTFAAKQSAMHRYFKGFVRDLATPYSIQARARTTPHFQHMVNRMNDARMGRLYFHDPSASRGDKGKGKGKGKRRRTEEFWTERLVAAGLYVGPYTSRPPFAAVQQESLCPGDQ